MGQFSMNIGNPKYVDPLFDWPDMIGDCGLDRGCRSQRLVNPREIVSHQVRPDRVFVVLRFLANPPNCPSATVAGF